MLFAGLSLMMAAVKFDGFKPVQWYGPQTVTFNVEFNGNPYDPEDNDVRVVFTPDPKAPENKGKDLKATEERIAFYDGDGRWRAVLVTQRPAVYIAQLWRNGKRAYSAPDISPVGVTAPLDKGFVRANGMRFVTDDGKPYLPVGFNLGWQTPGILPMTDQIKRMSENGLNWTRIWACAWDGKNPWWPEPKDPNQPADELWAPAFAKWDALIKATDTNNVAFQLVLFHHGLFSSTVNPNWPDHPWNAKNGGFLANAADFFTDAEAKRRARMWLRYAVARWGHERSLMAWELFNEVEWVDARYQNRWPDIEKWHAEMADYVRGIDPYHHLITTSSAMDRPDLWTKMDYFQPHTYPQNLRATIGQTRFAGKPGFFGEFGPPNGDSAHLDRAIRDGLITGVLAGHAGAAQYWFWDEVERRNLYPGFARSTQFIKDAEIVAHPDAQPVSLGVATEQLGDLVFRPGMGWERSRQGTFRLPDDMKDAESKVSSFLQSATAKPDMVVDWVFRFRNPAASSATIVVAESSPGGGQLRVFVNGTEALTKAYPASGTGNPKRQGDRVEVALPAGEVELKLVNDGPDWLNIGSLRLPGLAPTVQVDALIDKYWAAMRAVGPQPTSVTLTGLTIADGKYDVTALDFGSTESRTLEVNVLGGRAVLDLPYAENGLIWRSRY